MWLVHTDTIRSTTVPADSVAVQAEVVPVQSALMQVPAACRHCGSCVFELRGYDGEDHLHGRNQALRRAESGDQSRRDMSVVHSFDMGMHQYNVCSRHSRMHCIARLL